MLDDYTIWRPNPGYREKPGRVQRYGNQDLLIDVHGHRVVPGSPALEVQKPPGVRRILLVGGSHPFGMWVNPDEAYVEVLGAMLNRDQPGRWEVMNAASPGHTTFQGLRYIKHYTEALEPDIVLFDLGMNDTLPLSINYAAPDHEVMQVPTWAGRLGATLSGLPSYRVLKKALEGVVGRPRPNMVRVPMERQLANQEAVRSLGEERGFKTLFFSQVNVSPIGPGGRATCQYTPEGFEPYADVCEAFAKLGGNAGLHFHDPIHANATGHAIIAETVYDKLIELGWTK